MQNQAARRVAARFIEAVARQDGISPIIAGELEALAEDVEAGEEMAAWKPRRRQRGVKKRQRKKQYRRTRQKSKRQSQKWRKRNPSKVKRYQKKRKTNPTKHRLRRAKGKMPFWDLEHGLEGEITSINPDKETLQAVVDGKRKEYGMFPFLDTAAFTSEEGEKAFFDVLDDVYDRDVAEAALEGGGEMRQAKELKHVYMVRDVQPPTSYKDPTWKDSIYKMTLPAFFKFIGKVGISVWERDNSKLYDDQRSAVADAKTRVDSWIHRYDIPKDRSKITPYGPDPH